MVLLVSSAFQKKNLQKKEKKNSKNIFRAYSTFLHIQVTWMGKT